MRALSDWEKSVGHLEEGWSDEDLFRDQFENGEYHEHNVSRAGSGFSCRTDELCDIGLAVIRHLMAAGCAEEADLKTKDLMRFLEGLRRSQNSSLKTPAEILKPLADIREALFSKPSDSRPLAWRLDILRAFSIVELGIVRKIDLDTYHITTAYDHAESDLFEKLELK